MKNISIIFSIIIFILFISGCSNKTITENQDLEDTKTIVKNEEIKHEEVEQIENIDIENNEDKTIVIDPGHSSIGNFEKEPIAPNSSTTKAKDVLGATGISTRVPEHITTVSISNYLKEELINMGYNVVMTKTKVEESLSNIERAQIGNENNAALVIRIHADSSEDKSVEGASILVPAKNKYTGQISDISTDYGKTIIDTYTKELGIKNRGVVYRDDMTGFNWSKVPVVILEMGFLSNIKEDQYISNQENHKEIAKAIAKGIESIENL